MHPEAAYRHSTDGPAFPTSSTGHTARKPSNGELLNLLEEMEKDACDQKAVINVLVDRLAILLTEPPPHAEGPDASEPLAATRFLCLLGDRRRSFRDNTSDLRALLYRLTV